MAKLTQKQHQRLISIYMNAIIVIVICVQLKVSPRCYHQASPCLLGLTFLDFYLAPKRNKKFLFCGLDLVSCRLISWSPWRGFCCRWEVFMDLHYITRWPTVLSRLWTPQGLKLLPIFDNSWTLWFHC